VSDLHDDLEALPGRGGGSIVFQVGCGYRDADGTWRFAQWTADRLVRDEERRVLDAWFAHVAGLQVSRALNPDDVRVFHWSPAEPSWLGDEEAAGRDLIGGARTRHPEASWPQVPWFDLLLRVARAAPRR
jgi:hypothetical protein